MDLSTAGGIEQQLEEQLGDIWTATFINGPVDDEPLRRMRGMPGTFAERPLPEDWSAAESGRQLAFVVPTDTGCAVIEPMGWTAADEDRLAVLARGTSAAVVLRHAYATSRFCFAEDGVAVGGFDVQRPGDTVGAAPERLRPAMQEVGLAGDYADRPITRALALSSLLIGWSSLDLSGPFRSAEVEPWFGSASELSQVLTPDHLEDDGARIARAVLACSDPVRLRAVAVHEVRRLAGVLAVGVPGLAEALDSAEAGRPVVPAPDSELGRAVRTWLRQSREACYSLNSHSIFLTEDEVERRFRMGWFENALRGALHPDPGIAARSALYPITNGPEDLGDARAVGQVLDLLA